MNELWKKIVLILTFIAIALVDPAQALAAGQLSGPEKETSEESATWIVKWKNEPDPDFADTSVVVRSNPAMRVSVARPAPTVDIRDWLERWKEAPSVEYIVPNREVRLSAVVNDPLFERQNYLQQIRAPEAWSYAQATDSLTIAVIDTGVDLDHPDLKDNLVAGVNLIQTDAAPRDDNGHGTKVAGVLAAVGNNNEGVAGMLWKANIMPIKALDASGRGDEDKLGEAIRYAVDHGAKIVVLSVGLTRDDPFLREVVQYAEQKGVLLVAATGNDEGRNVRYPAAYPTVLAVGGVLSGNKPADRSNYGPELDIVAPWSVYTTALDGKYEYEEGTSMAAPQVAAVAAMIWSRYPWLKPYQIRNWIRQTAEDIDVPGWDIRTGYGLLRADRAMTQPYREDMFEPNDTPAEAKPFPVNTMISGVLQGGADSDWFVVDAPYDGTLRLLIEADAPPPGDVQWIAGGTAGAKPVASVLPFPQTIDVPVRKGRNEFALSFTRKEVAGAWAYRLTNTFSIYGDPFEENDRQYQAYRLPARTQQVVGTFHRDNDIDWFTVTIEQSGQLAVRLTTDTRRMDVVLMVQKKGEPSVVIDRNGPGGAESYTLEALPGTYYFRVSHVANNAVAGEYTLAIEYNPKYVDPNEPNDKPYQATNMTFDTVYEGVIHRYDDVDWYKINVRHESLVRFTVSGIPTGRTVTVSVRENDLTVVAERKNPIGTTEIAFDQRLTPGAYYIRLSANAAFQNQTYRFRLHADPLVGGFADIAGHWAASAIVRLSEKGVVTGRADYKFQPDQSITRAEAVAMIVRAFGYAALKPAPFSDVNETHWAYEAVAKAAQAGVIDGYPDGRFAPDRTVSRVEMAVMLARALNMRGYSDGHAPFPDVSASHWGAGVLRQLKDAGLITGYEDGAFRPEFPATRAEFAVLLERIVGKSI